jgi:hypothetical protein
VQVVLGDVGALADICRLQLYGVKGVVREQGERVACYG